MIKLRIVSGTLKNRYIKLPQSGSDFRPTLERTRQSVADSLQNRLFGATCADLCAGSGAFGFEMISRGAKKVDFVEPDKKRSSLILKNANDLSVASQCRVFTKNVQNFISLPNCCYDVVFYDPPYDFTEFMELVPQIRTLVAPDGVLVYQRRKSVPILGDGAPFSSKTYGDTIVDFYNSISV